jgi:hypothetical protein
MRMVEQWFGRDAKMILTSSPAFKREYFDRLSALRAPVVLLENKALQSSDSNAVCNGRRLENRPWRIGWFGAIRCAKSLKLLADFSRMADGRFEIVLRGRPAYSEFENFDAFVAAEPFMRFEGPYRNPEDLHEIYGEVDFAWAIDCFEEGQNSKWLLPNRLYEGCLHGAIPIAVAGTQTAAVLKQNNIGITLSEVTSSALTAAMEGLDRRRLDSLAASIAAVDRQAWVADEADCRNLVATLAALQPSAQFALQEQVQINSSYAI